MTEQTAQPTFDRIFGKLDGLGKSTKPSTVQTTTPIVGGVSTWIVQTMKTEDGFTVFVQMVDAEGRARFVLPDKVSQAIYRQRQSLTDRSTPQSRARKARSNARKRTRAAKAQ